MIHKWTHAQVTALKASIKHWEENCNAAESSDITLGTSACACCQKWNLMPVWGCPGCPVSAYTKLPGCDGSPYKEVAIAVTCRASNWRTACRKELAFLRRVLKAGTKGATK